MKTIILYHGDWDGIVSAWVAKKALMMGAVGGRLQRTPVKEEDIELEGVQYNQPFQMSISGADVYILDFSFPPDFMRTITEAAKRVTMIDHHVSAIKKWEGAPVPDNLKLVFDTEHAGCFLTYMYFFNNPEDPDDEHCIWEFPPLVAYAEDHDLWNFGLAFSREIRASMRGFNQSLEMCEKVNNTLVAGSIEGRDDPEYDAFILKGETIIEYQDHLVETAVRHAEQFEIAGYLCLGAQVPFDGLISLVAGTLAEKADEDRKGLFGLCWFKAKGNRWVYSLRSRGGDLFDVGEVARKMGGGGHPAAAGFSSDKPPTYFLAESVAARRKAEVEDGVDQ